MAGKGNGKGASTVKGLTHEDRIAIVKARLKGDMAATEVAGKFGVSRQYTDQLLQKYESGGWEAVKPKPGGRRKYHRLTEEEFDRVREVVAEHRRPSSAGVKMPESSDVWFFVSMRRLIKKMFKEEVTDAHAKDICKKLGLRQTFSARSRSENYRLPAGYVDPEEKIRLKEEAERKAAGLPDPFMQPPKKRRRGRPPKNVAPEEAVDTDPEGEICGDVAAMEKSVQETVRKQSAKGRARTAAAIKGARRPASRKKKVRHQKKRKRK